MRTEHQLVDCSRLAQGQGYQQPVGIFKERTGSGYCDAMFVDKECHTFLHDLPRAYRLPYPTRVFSLNNKQAFLDYLHDLEANADVIHLSEVRRLYGEDWPRPSLKMYKTRTGPSLDSKRPSGD